MSGCLADGGSGPHEAGRRFLVRVGRVRAPSGVRWMLFVALACSSATSQAPSQTGDADIVRDASFESGWDGFVSGSFAQPDGVSRDASRAYAGATAVRKALPTTGAGDVGGQFTFPFYAGPPLMPVPAQELDRVWVRFYFFFDAAIDGTLKFNIYEAAGFGTQFGGLYCANGELGWAFIQEWNSQFAGLVPMSSLANGWHSVEVDYWRNGDPSGFPSVAIWLDGTQLTGGIGSPPSPGRWVSGRLNAGERGSSEKIGTFNLLGVLNGIPRNTVAGNVWVDKVSVSSLGRIGQ